MASQRSGVEPPQRWRCMVSGCPQEGVWQDVVPGEEFIYDTADERSHYWREHYLASEAEYRARVAEQKERRMEHYRATGEFLPPEV